MDNTIKAQSMKTKSWACPEHHTRTHTWEKFTKSGQVKSRRLYYWSFCWVGLTNIAKCQVDPSVSVPSGMWRPSAPSCHSHHPFQTDGSLERIHCLVWHAWNREREREEALSVDMPLNTKRPGQLPCACFMLSKYSPAVLDGTRDKFLACTRGHRQNPNLLPHDDLPDHGETVLTDWG